MADRMTKEEMAAIREMLAETSTDPERRLLDELDAVMREQTQAQKRIAELEAELAADPRDYAKWLRMRAEAERRGYERGKREAMAACDEQEKAYRLNARDCAHGGNYHGEMADLHGARACENCREAIRQLKDNAGEGGNAT